MELVKLRSLPRCKFAHTYGDESYRNVLRGREDLIEVSYIKDGALEFTCGGCRQVAKTGDVFINFFLDDTAIESSGYHSHHTVAFTAEFSADDARELPMVISPTENSSQIYSIIDEIILTKGLYPDSEYKCAGLFLQLLYELGRAYEGGGARKNGEDYYVRKAKEYVYDRIREPISQSALAEYLGITPEYLCSVFKRATGESVIKFANRIKLENIRTLMERENTSLYRAAAMYGFADPNYVSRLYTKYYGVSLSDSIKLKRRRVKRSAPPEGKSDL